MAAEDAALRDLYQQVILDHSRHPRNQGRLDGPDCHHARGHNPACGDEVEVWLKTGPQGQIEDIRFEGQGCAISQASASLMTLALKGASPEAARRLMADFHALVTGASAVGDAEALGNLLALEGVQKFPQRIKCATLAWHAAEQALNQGTQNGRSS
ncbi:MAG: SUF system NifU family Fe-S cluster assembly protein [Prosthecobacter sp.]|jgi:nitrogen fixation NifU-like protein|nr:SUF system NifU family Fe-S cluster assembly protein [Prosthecobacter sp.]